jgi:hypothetical protein
MGIRPTAKYGSSNGLFPEIIPPVTFPVTVKHFREALSQGVRVPTNSENRSVVKIK